MFQHFLQGVEVLVFNLPLGNNRQGLRRFALGELHAGGGGRGGYGVIAGVLLGGFAHADVFEHVAFDGRIGIGISMGGQQQGGGNGGREPLQFIAFG